MSNSSNVKDLSLSSVVNLAPILLLVIFQLNISLLCFVLFVASSCLCWVLCFLQHQRQLHVCTHHIIDSIDETLSHRTPYLPQASMSQNKWKTECKFISHHILTEFVDNGAGFSLLKAYAHFHDSGVVVSNSCRPSGT